jgi:3D (Asp-Asp-Asp) domain-containing protein
MMAVAKLRGPVLLAACAAISVLAPGAIGSPQPHTKAHHKRKRPQRPLTKPTWLDRVVLTEYYPVPERWFVGEKVAAPGLAGLHRIDWLYSATGMSMEGDGIDLAGQPVHIAQLGDDGWINADGKPTKPGHRGRWSHGEPFWRTGGYWLDRARKPTFPLAAGGWSGDAGRRYVPLPGVSFAPGPSRPLRYYQSVAVDPRLIPLGSRIYIPAYKGVGGSDGWFVAADTGGAIIGRHLDIYRPPPAAAASAANFVSDARVYVVPPHAT